MKECCATCGHWVPDRPISYMMRKGGNCPILKKETRTDDYCWWWREADPGKLEARRKAGLIDVEE